MASNVTIYCLEDITDYFEFERLCHDLMALEGYSSIEPLGGFSDKGRDAIDVNHAGTTTVFAYSVREDWRAKLAEDARKIRNHGHKCDELVFISTARFTAGERDKAVGFIRDEFGWTLDLYGVERLRVLLEATHPNVRDLHPQIFPPHFFASQTKADGSGERDHLFLSYAPEDAILANWLARKLTAEGYLVWYEPLKLLGGETYPDDLDKAIKDQAFRVLGLYSRSCLNNPDLIRQRTLALLVGKERNEDFLIPLSVDGVTGRELDSATASLQFIPFQENWAVGLHQVLEKLESINAPRPLLDGRRLATQALVGDDVMSGQTEQIFSNCFLVERIPDFIERFRAVRTIPEQEIKELQLAWAFHRTKPGLFLSFHEPPPSFLAKYQFESAGGASWSDLKDVDGIRSRDLVSELLKKSLLVLCYQKGLEYCPESDLFYFPSGLVEGDHLKYTKPDGSKTFVSAVGQRTYWRPTVSEPYRYYLAPEFAISGNLFGPFTVLMRMRVRLSDVNDVTLAARTRVSRRKHLCKNWWNDDWLNRILAVSQFLARDEKFMIGEVESERIIVSAVPVCMEAPEGISEAALDQLSFEREEIILDEEAQDEVDDSTGNT